MDYGPFGWMEEYNPVFAKWTGSGEHFGFFNQHSAGYANYDVLASSVVQVICAARGEEDPDETYVSFMNSARDLFQDKVDETIRLKMGFRKDDDSGELWEKLEPLLRVSRTDWTVFWRQLTYVAGTYPDLESLEFEDMMALLEGEGDSSPFYEQLDPTVRRQWIAWIQLWRDALRFSQTKDIYKQMKSTNPKYVLREWMLVDAYSAAGFGDETILKDMYELIQDPYGEGTEAQQEQFYRRAPERALTTGGTAFMS